MKTAALWIAAAGLLGCTPGVEHRVTAPQIDAAIQALQKPKCPPLMPIPAKMRIELDGQYIDTDAEGERFLRAYVASRDCYRGVK
jgi:hypothetical protein